MLRLSKEAEKRTKKVDEETGFRVGMRKERFG